MIHNMQRKLTVFALLVLLLITGGFVFTVNYTNTATLRQQAQNSLQLLLESDGRRPALEADSPGQMPPAGGTLPLDDGTAGRIPQRPPGGLHSLPIHDRSYITNLSNSYSVRLNREQELLGWFSDRPELYDDAQIEGLAALALETGQHFGRIGNQFFAAADRPYGTLLVFLDTRMEHENAQRLLLTSSLTGLGTFLILGFGAAWLIRRMTRPVQEAFDKQRQFVWDASHELKTPLAVISANADALASEVGESRWLDYIRSEVQRTDLLVKNLLILAQMSGEQTDRRHSPFDLSSALLSVALPFDSAAFEGGKLLQLQVEEGLFYTGDEEMIKQLAVILLDNALKYSDDGGQITMTLTQQDTGLLLRVHNTGIGISREALPRVFERFYRADPSRSHEIAGHGMGLSIAKTIVEAHQGTITAESEEGQWVCLTVVLPNPHSGHLPD